MASGSGTTLVRKSAGQPFTVAYEGRNVFIISLPEVLLLHMDKCTAEEVYKQWLECEIIIGPRPSQGYDSRWQ